MSLNRVMPGNMGQELQPLWVVEGGAWFVRPGCSDAAGQRAPSPARCRAADLPPEAPVGGDGSPTRLLFLRLSTAKVGCCLPTPAWFTPGVFKICLESGEPNTPVTGEREREWRLSPASVVQDGIYDL